MVTFQQFVRPVLLRQLGSTRLFRPTLEVRLAAPLRKKAGRMHFERVVLERRDGAVLARSTGTQSSGALRSMTLAQGLLVFPAEATELRAGDTATVQVIDESFLLAGEPGY